MDRSWVGHPCSIALNNEPGMDHILTLRLREGIGDAGHQSGHFRCEQMRNCIPLVDPRALLQASPFGLSGDANDEEKRLATLQTAFSLS